MTNQFNRKSHWENIYEHKSEKEVSWYQAVPETSLSFFEKLKTPKNAKIIDVGGGESFLVDNLLRLGYENITVLDISEKAIEKTKKRLGKAAQKVKWIVADIVEFNPNEKYDFWHDRAVFHFLTAEKDIQRYLELTQNYIEQNGRLVMGTFSENGPTKCSGIEIKQYSEITLNNLFAPYFEKTNAFNVKHPTPFDTMQDFVFCSFRRK